MTVIPLPAYGVANTMTPPPTTILAFDPGGTTGWFRAAFNPADGEVSHTRVGHGHIEGTYQHRAIGKMIEAVTHETRHLVVVAENYVPEFGQAQRYIALEYLGVMEYVCRQHMIPFVRQTRAEKTYWTREKMLKVGLWPTGQTHAQDAGRHWLAYAVKGDFPTLKAHILGCLR